MAKDRKKLVHIHSKIMDKQPRPEALEVGEIAVNNAEGKEFLSIKNSNPTNPKVVRFSSDEQMIFWTEKKEVIPFEGQVRGEDGPESTKDSGDYGSYGITNNDLLNNKSNLVIKFNQVAASNTPKSKLVNGDTGGKDIYGNLVNGENDSSKKGAGIAIDMSRYAMRGANPSFSSLTITNGTTLEGDLNVSGNTRINKNLTVSGNTNVSGSTTIKGNTNISGNTRIDKNLTVSGNTNVSGSTTIKGNTNISGDTKLQKLSATTANVTNLYATNNISGSSLTAATISGTNLTANTISGGSAVIGGDLNVSGNTKIGNGLNVTGATNINGATKITGDTTFNGNETVNGNLTVTSNTNISGDTRIKKTLTVDGATKINNDLTVTGNTNISGNTRIDKNLTVSGNTNISGNTTIKGATNISGATRIDNNLTVTGKVATKDLEVTGVLTIPASTCMTSTTISDAFCEVLSRGELTFKVGDYAASDENLKWYELYQDGEQVKDQNGNSVRIDIPKDHILKDAEVVYGTLNGTTFTPCTSTSSSCHWYIKLTWNVFTPSGHTDDKVVYLPADDFIKDIDDKNPSDNGTAANHNVVVNVWYDGKQNWVSAATTPTIHVTNAYAIGNISGATISGTNGKFTNLSGNTISGGNATFAGTVNISGTTNISRSLNVTGNTNISGETKIDDDLTVTGNANISGATRINNNLTVSGETNISGATKISRSLTVTGNTNISGETKIDDNLIVTGNISGGSITGELTGIAASANCLTTSAGSTTKPVYFDSTGKPVAISYTIKSNVPTGAVFTDTATTKNGHYAISAETAGTKSATASSTSELNWGSAVVTGVTLSGDAKGHITAIALKSGKLKTPSDTWRSISREGIPFLTADDGKTLNFKEVSGITINTDSSTGNITIGTKYSAGRAIGIGTDYKIYFDLPISAGTGTNSIIEGGNTQAKGLYSHAEGQNTIASGNSSHAEGANTKARGNYSHAEGLGTSAIKGSDHAEGENTTASGGTGSHAEGYKTIAIGQSSHAEGWSTSATSIASHAEGDSTTAIGSTSHVEGTYTVANNEAEHASGMFNVSRTGSTDGDRTLFTVGNGTSTSNRKNAFEIRKNGDTYVNGVANVINTSDTTRKTVIKNSGTTISHIVDGTGGGTAITSIDSSSMSIYATGYQAPGSESITLDKDSIKFERYYGASGSVVSSSYSKHHILTINSNDIELRGNVAEGDSTVASGISSHAEGVSTTAYGDYSHAEGENTTTSGASSHAEGSSTKALGAHSHAEGDTTTASGQSSHAEGAITRAIGQYSHAEGVSTTASGQSSHAEGDATTASGTSSHAEGSSTNALGTRSHAEGYYTQASGNYSHAEGNHTETKNQSEHASGQYNVSSSASTTFGDGGNTLFSVGNGTSTSARHNAFEIRQNGDAIIGSIDDQGQITNNKLYIYGESYYSAGIAGHAVRVTPSEIIATGPTTWSIKGTGMTAQAFYATSDERLKENIENVSYAKMANAANVDIKSFNFKNDEEKKTVIGVIAQDVEKENLGFIVSTSDDGMKAVDYTGLSLLKIAYLEQKIKELENIINELKENKQ